MKNFSLAFLSLSGVLVLASCGGQQTTPAMQAMSSQAKTVANNSVAAQIAAYAQRPETQDPETQEIIKANSNDPEMLDALQLAYGDKTEDLSQNEAKNNITAQSRLSWLQSVAWGTPEHYDDQRNKAKADWSTDGCSTHGMGLTWHDEFFPACKVHDFGYRNLPKLATSSAQREDWKKTTDDAFYNNMKKICGRVAVVKKPGCYSAALAYLKAVQAFGDFK